MRALFTVRNSLLAISGIGTALILWFAASFWLAANAQRVDAARVLWSTTIEDLLIESAVSRAAERTLVQAALNSGEPVSPERANAIETYRSEASARFERARAALREDEVGAKIETMLARAAETFDRLEALQGQIDAQLRRPRESRDAAFVAPWLPASTDVIASSQELRVSLRRSTRGDAGEIETLRDLRHAVWMMGEFANREGAMIAGTIAARYPLVLEDVERLSVYRGQLNAAWLMVSGYTQEPHVVAEVAAEIEHVRRQYFDAFERIRVPIISAGMQGAPYPVSSAGWITQATEAIAPIRRLDKVAGAIVRSLTVERHAAGVRGLIVATIILAVTMLLCAASIRIVVVRIVRPLEGITVAMGALATGDAGVAVPSTDEVGEIGTMARAVAVFRESADRRTGQIAEMNQRLAAINEELEERVRTRTAELASARDRAVAANNAKSAFLANMSHELRTPLTAIIGYSEILLREVDSDSRTAEELGKIEAWGKHLLALINDILDLSKIEAGRMEIDRQSFDVAELVGGFAETIGSLAGHNGNRFEANCPANIGAMISDITKVRQALLNLLGNACKFTSNGVVRLTAARERGGNGDEVVFTVTDTGIGIPEDQLDRIFDAFTQADSSTTRAFGGTGLGLAITMKVCEALGGSIAVESEPGCGAKFIVRLPAFCDSPPAGAVIEPDERTLPSASEKSATTILVIDDDASVRDLLRRHLVDSGYHVMTASGGEEGLRRAREHRPDAITLDVLMPNVDGWAVLAALKSDPALAPIPVVVISVLADRSRGFSLGAHDFLTKPVSRERLLTVLERHCRARSSPRALIVDDEAMNRDVIRRLLESEGWSVAEAENGAVALARLEAERPDVILLDLMMPVMDGFEFLDSVREVSELTSIPVVVVTAKYLTAEDHQRLNGRIEAILEKGDHLDRLLALLDSLLPERPATLGAGETPRTEVAGGEVGIRDALITNMRQDLLAPASAILSYSRLLQDEAAQAKLPQLTPTIERLLTWGREIFSLVDGLLDGDAAAGEAGAGSLKISLDIVRQHAERMTDELEDFEGNGLAPLVLEIGAETERLLGKLDAIVRFHSSVAMANATVRALDADEPGEAAAVPVDGRILVVDDNESNRELLSRQLTYDGHRPVLASGGAEALRLLDIEDVDLILLDLMMPDMSGLDVLRRLKADPRLRNLPVIIISALGELESVVRCIEAGAEDYLSKPFNSQLLRARINACLMRGRWREAGQGDGAQAEGEGGKVAAVDLGALSDKDRKLRRELLAVIREADERLARDRQLTARTLARDMAQESHYRFGEQTLRKIINRRYPSLYRLGLIGARGGSQGDGG